MEPEEFEKVANENNIQILDTRDLSQYVEEHIPYSINIPL